MTLTTIGYGDVLAKTDAERGVMLVIMFVGAFIYAYAVGTISSILGSMDTVKHEFYDSLDNLNVYMREKHIPKDAQARVRAYLHFSLDARRSQHFRELLDRLTPSLKQKAIFVMNQEWTEKLPFQAQNDPDFGQFIELLSAGMFTCAFPPGERLIYKDQEMDRLFILSRGTVLIHARGDYNSLAEAKTSKMMTSAVDLNDAEASHLRIETSVPSDIVEILSKGTLYIKDIREATTNYVCVFLVFS